MKRVLTTIMFVSLLLSMLTFAFNTQSVKASGTIYIRADGSIDPPTAPIATTDNVTYTFTGNIYDEIVVKRDNTIIDGMGHTVEGTEAGDSKGIDLTERSNVTIENTTIKAFYYGIWLYSSSGNNISENNITNNNPGIWLDSSSGNSISGNDITANNNYGILLYYFSSYNSISENNITNNRYGINLYSSGNNIFHNNFINNTQQVYSFDCVNVWDDGYPSGGNYWSDYAGVDRYSGPNQDEIGNDGIGDTPYVIDVDNRDSYPFMVPWGTPYRYYDWPMFRHDLNHSGYSTSNAPTTNHILWNYTTDNSVDSSPAIADGKVYVGSDDRNVYCLDASTGVKLWNYTTGDKVYSSSPAVVDGKVYVGSLDHSVYCFDAFTGAKLWNYTTGDLVYSSPAVADGKVYVGSWDCNVYCLNASTGAKLWNYYTYDLVYSSPAVADGKVYVGAWNGVFCFGVLESDVTVTNVTSTKTLIGQSYEGNVTVTAQYLGDFTENFNVTTYANLTDIESLNFDLTNGSTASKLFVWNTTGFAYGNYTLKAAADVVSGETNTANNNFTCSFSVHVGVPGDVSGPTPGVYDGTCNMRDIQYLILLFNTNPSSPNWKPNADINNDGTVNMRDIQIAILNFNKDE